MYIVKAIASNREQDRVSILDNKIFKTADDAKDYLVSSGLWEKYHLKRYKPQNRMKSEYDIYTDSFKEVPRPKTYSAKAQGMFDVDYVGFEIVELEEYSE